jgi:hypothetical protein
MKRTGRNVYLSGRVGESTADAIYEKSGTPTVYFQNILVDERRGYAYKVTFMSAFPNVTVAPTTGNVPFALQSFSTRELQKMSQASLALHGGHNNQVSSLSMDNRTIGIYGYNTSEQQGYNMQNQYVIKGDAMVTQSLSLAVDIINTSKLGSFATYYIELEEYEVSDNEEILLLLNERAQNAAGLVD